ncbi:alpha/beta fold hydrolase [Kocuria rhizosphaericola]|uniref:alpha/beta fold hydrolase n=1 Tax=Kocuria rhizosphaericola TaxID=3376284 RepID=UPI0037B2D46C
MLEALSAAPAVVIGRSTGGEIALELARRHPDKVAVLVLLEPAVFTLDPQAASWAEHLREMVLAAAAGDPSAASEVVFRQALGDQAWESLPHQLRDHFAAAGPAVLAEIRAGA